MAALCMDGKGKWHLIVMRCSLLCCTAVKTMISGKAAAKLDAQYHYTQRHPVAQDLVRPPMSPGYHLCPTPTHHPPTWYCCASW
jgi:hypothetical protein